MKLNFITDQGSILDMVSWALRVCCAAPLTPAPAAAALGGRPGLAAPVFGRIWNGAVTLAVIGLDDLSPFGGRAGLAAPVLDRARNGNGARLQACFHSGNPGGALRRHRLAR